MWLIHDRGLDDVLSDIRALNGPYRVFAPAIQAGFTTRLKTEQANDPQDWCSGWTRCGARRTSPPAT